MNKMTDEAGTPLFVVGIGASAGGLEALRDMLSTAGEDCKLAFVVIQHLDPNHESLLAELLDRHTVLEVSQAEDGEKVRAGCVHIIPPGHGLSINSGTLRLTDFSQPRGLRRPIDDFFESLAQDQGRNAACVILSGTGADGSAGLRAIKELGGLCVVQEPRTAKYDGMPTSAINTGLVDFINVPSEIIESVQQFFTKAALTDAQNALAETVNDTLEDICSVVRTTAGHDFAGYKTSTLSRRVQRRIQVLDLDDAREYLAYIRSTPEECEILFRELLINVTRFFRDTSHFEVLRNEVIKPLVRDAQDEEIRVWVPGCSSGEEAYSIAMLFAEEVRLQRRSINIQVFATDIDEQMLRIARDGMYPAAALVDIPEEMRELYTLPREGKFQINSRIRDMIRFSVHSVVRDPPFSNIDLLSCRNLLIYFGDTLQAAVMPIFHYALRPGATLFLGPSETLGRHDHMFHPVDAQARIFERNEGRPEYPVHLRNQSRQVTTRRQISRDEGKESTRVDWSDKELHDRILTHYGPATLHVSREGELLGSTGRLGRYLSTSTVGAMHTQYASSLAVAGVREAISSVIRQVTSSSKRTISRDLIAHSEFGAQPFDLIGDPMRDGTILLVFRERGPFAPMDEDELDDVDATDSHVQSLENELRSTRARLHTTVEELETANEELKSSNEEMMSMNEELQSTNEELATVNDELKVKVDELSVADTDLSNFFSSTALPLVVLDAKGVVRNFTESILTLYPLRAGDRGRPLSEVTCRLAEADEVLAAIDQVMHNGEEQYLRVSDHDAHRTWSLIVTPYRDRDDEIDGVTLVFSELTEALLLEDKLKSEGERLRIALDVTGLGVWELSRDGRTIKFDDKGAELLGLETNSLKFSDFIASLPEKIRDETERTMRISEISAPFNVLIELPSLDQHDKCIQFVGRRIGRAQGQRTLGVLFDVTEEEEAKRVREIMLHEMNHRVKNLFSIISGMVRIAGHSAKSVPALVEGVTARIGALARSHNMTHQAPSGTYFSLEEVVDGAVQPYRGQSAGIEISGPEVHLTPETLTTLSLIFHELATNTAKYGVLGPIDGKLRINWEKHDEHEILLNWTELYNDPVTSNDNESNGFGSTMMQLSASQLNGRIFIERSESERRTQLIYENKSK